MGLFDGLKRAKNANEAYKLHANGNLDAAEPLYDQAFAQGALNGNAKILLGYAILLLRKGRYTDCIEVLKRAEKAPGVNAQQKQQIMNHYALALWKMGKTNRGIQIIQELFNRGKTGALYSTLGYMIIDEDDPEEALRFNREAVDYDEDDPVFLDNLAQTYYRALDDRDTAKEYFEKAYAKKATAIDTNYFLAQYDLVDGNIDGAVEKLETAQRGSFSPLNFATKTQVEQQLEALRIKDVQAAKDAHEKLLVAYKAQVQSQKEAQRQAAQEVQADQATTQVVEVEALDIKE